MSTKLARLDQDGGTCERDFTSTISVCDNGGSEDAAEPNPLLRVSEHSHRPALLHSVLVGVRAQAVKFA